MSSNRAILFFCVQNSLFAQVVFESYRKIWSSSKTARKTFPCMLISTDVFNDCSGKLTFRPGNLVCMLFFWDDHDSLHIFSPRQRFQVHCGISFFSSSTLYIPPVMQTWLIWIYPPCSPSVQPAFSLCWEKDSCKDKPKTSVFIFSYLLLR